MSPTEDHNLQRTYEIDYHRFTRTKKNLDFKGKGTIEISEDGRQFVFRGKQATLLGIRRDLVLDRDNIANVAQHGDMISFTTSKGESGAKKKPFLFYCKSPEAAAEIASRFPATQTEHHQEEARRLELFDATCPPIPARPSPTYIIAAINIVVFVLVASLGGAGWFEPNIEPYIRYGASNGAYTTSGEWWRLFTSMFLHFGLLHLALNTWVLKDVGRLLERITGRAAFIALYLATGITASLASVIWYQDTVWSAGASGAVFGIYGALLALSLRDNRNLPLSLFAPIRKSSFAFIAYNLFYGLSHEGIDNAAHIGGLVSGFALGAIIACSLDAPNRESLLNRKLRHFVAASVALIATGVSLCPTFDYDPYEQDELFVQWNAFGDEEMKSYSQTEKILNQAEESPEKRAQAIETLRHTLIPLYQKWTDTFSSTSYQSESSTERSRSLLADYAHLKAQSYQAFIDYLASPSDQNNETYWNLANQADAKVEALNQE